MLAKSGLLARVVLLHGITESSGIMRPLERALSNQGYAVSNISYPSTDYDIDTLAQMIRQQLGDTFWSSTLVTHFVGHSMGGLVIRSLLAKQAPVNMGKVVCIGTPHLGSEVSDWVRWLWLYRRWFGPAGQQLVTKKNAFLKRLPYPSQGCGMIAGNQPASRWLSRLVFGSQPNDGKVSVVSAHGVAHFPLKVVPVSHKQLPQDGAVMTFVERFLRTGDF